MLRVIFICEMGTVSTQNRRTSASASEVGFKRRHVPLAAADDLVFVARNSGLPNGVPLVSPERRLWAGPALCRGCYFWEEVISRKGGKAQELGGISHFRVGRNLPFLMVKLRAEYWLD
jgi:hypothetical protein